MTQFERAVYPLHLIAVWVVVLLLSLTGPALAQPRGWRTLRSGTLLRVTVERDSAVWAFVGMDSARLDLLGPCTGASRFECPETMHSVRLDLVHAVSRRTDRVLEGLVLGTALGLGVGALGHLYKFPEEGGSLAILTMPFFGTIGAVVGGIVGSKAHRWVALPPPRA